MDTQEKFVHSGPQYPYGSEPQYQQQPMMQDQPQPPVRTRAFPGPTADGEQGGKWQASLCSCTPCTSCLLAWCLPCIRKYYVLNVLLRVCRYTNEIRVVISAWSDLREDQGSFHAERRHDEQRLHDPRPHHLLHGLRMDVCALPCPF